MNYYQQSSYVSNSDLSSYQDMTSHEESDRVEAYAFGALLHAWFTEPHKIDTVHHRLKDSEYPYNQKQWMQALNMYLTGMKDSMILHYHKHAKFEYEFYRKQFAVEHEGIEVVIPTRIKIDMYLRAHASALDIKSTVCKTLNSFKSSIIQFDYDRQAAWYMDNAKPQLQSFTIAGISKAKGHTVFKHTIQRGDESYLQGKQKYSKLAVRYKFKILNLFS